MKTPTLKEFLDANNIQVTISKVGYRTAHFSKDDEKRMIYHVTIINLITKKKTSYDFGQSIDKSFYRCNTGRPFPNQYKYFDNRSDAMSYNAGTRYSIQNPSDPTIEDVLYCAYEEPSSFQDFCDNFGYDSDSIQAKNTYEKVQEQSYNLLNVLRRDKLEAINDILQDY